MKAKKLPVEEIKFLFRYDAETGFISWAVDRVGGNGAVVAKAGDIAGHTDRRGYKFIHVGVNNLYLQHRVAWLLHYGVEPAENIDHVNGDRSDNRMVNLRLANKAQNAMNVGLAKNNSSGIRGVYWSKERKKWVAQFANVGLGRHACLGKAISAYKGAVKEAGLASYVRA